MCSYFFNKISSLNPRLSSNKSMETKLFIDFDLNGLLAVPYTMRFTACNNLVNAMPYLIQQKICKNHVNEGHK